jgi:hypothetical protein
MKTIPIVMISAVMAYIMFSQRKTQKIKIKIAKQHEKLMSCDKYIFFHWIRGNIISEKRILWTQVSE